MRVLLPELPGGTTRVSPLVLAIQGRYQEDPLMFRSLKVIDLCSSNREGRVALPSEGHSFAHTAIRSGLWRDDESL